MLDAHGEDRVFDSVSNRTLRGYGSVAGAVGLILFALVGFFLSIRGSPGLLSFHSMTTVPLIIAVGLFASAFVTLRSPTRVIVGEQELTVMRGQMEVGRWRWEQIALAPAGQAAVSNKRVLKLYGEAGKVLVTLSDDLSDFDTMAAEIKRRMAEHPSAQRSKVALGKGRRNGVLLTVGGILFFALAFFNGWNALNERQAADLLRTQGQPAQAVIVRKFTAPDGRTRRIEYRVDAPDAPLANVEVAPLIWTLLQERQRIAVTAVPGRPDISRLIAGQIDDSMQGDPRLMLILSVAIGVISIVFFIVGTLSLRGLEVKWDSQRRRPRLDRVG